MDPLVESAKDAANRGDKIKAFELIEQAINSNPNDLEALFVLANLAEEPAHKRQALNRILSLESTNQVAREMMLEMDRAEINSHLSRPTGASVSKTQSPSDASHFSPGHLPQKPMLFQYPKGWLVILYVFTTLSCCGTLWFAAINITISFPFLATFLSMALVLGLTALTISSRVEVDEKVIRISSMLRSVEMNWDEIGHIEFDSLKRNLELVSNIGELAKISTEVNGYRTIVELLRQKRPDLFTEAFFSPKQAGMSPAGAVPLPSNTYKETIPPSGSSEQPKPAASTSPVPSQPASPTFQHQTAPPLHTSSDLLIEKPLTFRYSTVWLIGLYLFTTIFLCTGLLLASQSVANSLPSWGLALLFGLTALSNSSKVEIRESGIRTSNLLSRAEMRWREIAEVKSNAAGKKLELSSKAGETLKISSQLKGYPVIVEILRQKRPDLFNLQASPSAKKSTLDARYDTSLPQDLGASTFGETRIFRKGFFKQFGLSLLGISLCILFVWLASASSENRTAFLVTGGFCALIMIVPFFQVSSVRMEANKLTIETFFEQKEFAARQIREIKMQSIRGRYGRVTNIVNIIPAEGKNYPLGGFSDGDEIIYGTLMNWWNTYRNP